MKLKFKIEDQDGKPAKDLEPYMGMAGHAEMVSSDWSVFAHIHPAGSVSMAALEMASAGGTVGAVAMDASMPSAMGMPMAIRTDGAGSELSVRFSQGWQSTGFLYRSNERGKWRRARLMHIVQ